MDVKKIIQSKGFTRALIAVGVLAAALVVFQAGVWTGYRKAAYSFRGGENYFQAFGGPRGKFAPGLPHGEMPDAHGAAGRILSVELPSLVVEGVDGVEKTVMVSDATVVRRYRDAIKSSDLKIDDEIVVIGEPNSEAQIEAKLIRVMPFPMPKDGRGGGWLPKPSYPIAPR
jgi:hypothetical protein